MSIKFSQFPVYNSSLGEPTEMQGVGLQAGQNVRWPAWFLQSVEHVTTNHTTDTYINPDVYTTFVTSDGSGNVQNINLPQVTSSILSTSGLPGLPHCVIFDVQPNYGDTINIVTDAQIYYFPFNPGVAMDDRDQGGFLFDAYTTPPSTLQLPDGGQAICFMWDGADAWYVTAATYRASIVPPNAGQYWDNLSYPTWSVLIQDQYGEYYAVPDPTNPEFSMDVTASTDPTNPTLVPASVRYVTVHGAPGGVNSYFYLEPPVEFSEATNGLDHIIRGQQASGGGRILIPTSYLSGSELRGPDGNNNFTTFDITTSVVYMQAWYGSWYVDGFGSQNLYGNVVPYPGTARFLNAGYPWYNATAGNTVAGGGALLTPQQNYGIWGTDLGQPTYTLPTGYSTGAEYSFVVQPGNFAETMTVAFAGGTWLNVNGKQYGMPVVSSNETGASITFRDIGGNGNNIILNQFGGGGYQIVSSTGTWTINAYAFWFQIDQHGVTIDPTALIATTNQPAGSPASCYAWAPQTFGRYYFEVTFTTAHVAAGNNLGMGITYYGYGWNTYPPNGTGGVIMHLAGDIWVNGTNTGITIGNRAQGDVIGIAVDLDTHQIWYKKVNGTPTGWNSASAGSNDPAANIGGIAIPGSTRGIYPGCGFGGTGGGANDSLTANFGKSAFVGAVPVGFTSGWPQ